MIIFFIFQAMEIGFDINEIKFSSIVINLTSMSRQSQMELLKKCRESPQFLKRWIQKLVLENHTHLLKEKKINRMTFTIKLCFPTLEQSKCHFCSYFIHFSSLIVFDEIIELLLHLPRPRLRRRAKSLTFSSMCHYFT